MIRPTLAATLLLMLASFPASAPLLAQAPAATETKDPKAADPSLLELPPLPPEAHVRQSIVVGGHRLDYTVTVSALPIRDEKGRKIAEVVCTAYTLDGPKPEGRPVTFAMNGGPGSASVWLNMGCLGPKRVQFGTQGDLPSNPVGTVDNPATWLDFTDLIFIDPVGTGYSRALVGDEEAKKRFFNVKGDVSYLARIIYDWLFLRDRMSSTKFMVGESYSGIRVPKVAYTLESEFGVGLSGVVMVSPVMDGGTGHLESLSPMPWIGILPTYAAANLEVQGRLAPEAMAAVEAYASTEYPVALLKGYADPASLDQMATRIGAFTGLDPARIRLQGGRIDFDQFFRDRLRDKGLVSSAYDINRTMPDPFPWKMEDDSDWTDPSSRDGALAAGAIVDFYGRVLAWKPQGRYFALNLEVNQKWENGSKAWFTSRESTHDLRRFLALDPQAKVLIAHGYTDLACPYFFTKIILSQIPANCTGDRLRLKVYPGGHMFYNRLESHLAFTRDARALLTGK